MKFINFKSLCFISFVLSSAHAMGGAGWVGNSPMMMAYQPIRSASDIYKQSVELTEDNSILLRQGQKRFNLVGGLSLSKSSHSDPVYGFSFDYGLSKRWNIINTTSLAYDINPDTSDDDRLAIYFGFDGLVQSLIPWNNTGLLVAPTAGLLHRYRWGHWTLHNSFNLGGYHYANQKGTERQWQSAWTSLATNLNHELSYNWLLDVGFSVGLEKRRVDHNTLQTSYTEDLKSFSPTFQSSVSVTRRLSENSSITPTISYSNNTGFLGLIGFSINW